MSFVKRSFPVAVFIIIAVGVGWMWLNRQYIQDWQAVQSFTPTAEVAAIPERSSMSDKGAFLFYASHPSISDASEFNHQCARRETSSAILGCYDGVHIYLYHIKNPELNGMTEVTAAHEMLHAAWKRLGDNERARLETHLEAVYDRLKTADLEERMAYYERQQPGERTNELHSILGTEFHALDPYLEEHYSRYFTNRQVIVSLHKKYVTVSDTLRRQSETLRQEIETLVKALNTDIAAHNMTVSQLEAEVTMHNGKATSIDTADPVAVQQYNMAQTSLMARRTQLQRDEEALAQRQNIYQQKVAEYNKLVIRSETLVNSMDSLKSPQSTAK